MNSRTRSTVALAWTLLAAVLCGCAATSPASGPTPRTRVVSRAAAAPPSQAPRPERTPTRGELPVAPGLGDYLAFGLRHSPDLQASFEDWHASKEEAEQVSSLPAPRFTYGEFLEEVQTRTGPQERRFGLSQAFPWPGELGVRERVAERRAEAFRWRAESARLELVREIELAFHDYAFLARELEITGELLELLRGLDPVVQSRVRAGGGQADLLRLQVEIGRLEDDLASLERRRPALSARMADAIGLTGGAPPLPLPELSVPSAEALDPGQLRERALASSPHLHALSQEFSAHREAEELAGFARRPSFALGLDYIDTGDASGVGVVGSGDDPVLLTLSVHLPVWSASYSAAERQARHRVRAARARMDAAASELSARIEAEAARIDDAARRIGLYRDSLIPRAADALQLSLTDYRTGEASVLDLIDSERALLEFELSQWRACREYLQGEARLRALIGEGR
jgi:cobalt-zinc-cadmium efflux system outer membrane protein